MAIIDTHSLIEEMVAAGVKKQQAVIFTKAINNSNDNLVTKSDLKIELSYLRTELSNVKHDLEIRMDKLDNNLTWLKGIGFVAIGLLVKIAFF